MILGRYTKQPVEVKDYDIDYGEWLAPVADDLDEVQTLVECLSDPNDTSLQVDSAQVTATVVKLWISGGTNGRACGRGWRSQRPPLLPAPAASSPR